jgi:pimeloyl-ACP methyl ester carboxylesterase
MVDLGGYRIHLYCTGKGKQTVVLSPGGGDFSFVWYFVQEKLQTSARVCSYDRAGSAWSDPGPQPVTMRQEAYELEMALRLAGEKGPYILVGHSLGGLVVRTFAEGYSDETAGMVLVDATSPDASLGYFGKPAHVRDLAKRTIPPVQTMKTSPLKPISDAEREQAMKYRNHNINPPYDRLPAEIQHLQLWAQMLPPKIAVSQDTDYTPEEFQLLYGSSSLGIRSVTSRSSP